MNLSVNGDEFHDDDDVVPRTGRRTSPNPTAGDATDEHWRPVAVTTARAGTFRRRQDDVIVVVQASRMHRRASLSLEAAAAAAMTVDDDVDASDDATRINPRAIDRRVIVSGGPTTTRCRRVRDCRRLRIQNLH